MAVGGVTHSGWGGNQRRLGGQPTAVGGGNQRQLEVDAFLSKKKKEEGGSVFQWTRRRHLVLPPVFPTERVPGANCQLVTHLVLTHMKHAEGQRWNVWRRRAHRKDGARETKTQGCPEGR